MKKKHWRFWIMLCLASGILLACTLGRAAYGKNFPNRLCAVQAVSVVEETAAADRRIPSMPDWNAAKQHSVEKLKDGLQLRFGGGKNVNILLIGRDAAGNSDSRSDAMILCTFNKEQNTITMTSFLRDLYVKIPGYKSNRINAAYRFGGTKLLDETLHENFGINVDGNLLVDFECFEKIIDSLGGITLELTAAEADFINDHTAQDELTEGYHLLTGQQALAHVRNRCDTDGDFSRTNRQRSLLRAVLETLRSKSLPEILDLLKEMGPMITTDISRTDLTAYAVTLFPMLSGADIRTQAIPVEGAYSYEKINGKSVLIPDLQKNIQVLQDTLS